MHSQHLSDLGQRASRLRVQGCDTPYVHLLVVPTHVAHCYWKEGGAERRRRFSPGVKRCPKVGRRKHGCGGTQRTPCQAHTTQAGQNTTTSQRGSERGAGVRQLAYRLPDEVRHAVGDRQEMQPLLLPVVPPCHSVVSPSQQPLVAAAGRATGVWVEMVGLVWGAEWGQLAGRGGECVL